MNMIGFSFVKKTFLKKSLAPSIFPSFLANTYAQAMGIRLQNTNRIAVKGVAVFVPVLTLIMFISTINSDVVK